jgi:hypothetical protein
LTELLVPPALPGPAGTPLTPVVPAPAEPALEVPAAPDVVPPAEDAPPADPPLEDPPAPCAKAAIGSIRLAMTATAIVDFLDMNCLRLLAEANENCARLFLGTRVVLIMCASATTAQRGGFTIRGGLTKLYRRLQFPHEPADISGPQRIRCNRDFFDVIAAGTIERSELKSGWSRRDAHQHHAGVALFAAQPFNGEQRNRS